MHACMCLYVCVLPGPSAYIHTYVCPSYNLCSIIKALKETKGSGELIQLKEK